MPIKNKFEPIFISGCPRSGTTITYQLIVSYFYVSFFSNNEKHRFDNPIISTLINRSPKYKPDVFESNYGIIQGKHSPSDGWGVFHKWFPYYYNPQNNFDTLQQLKKTIAWFDNIYNKPFVVKNNANSLRILELHKMFPKALFIHVNRNKYDNIHSIFKGLLKNNIPLQQIWGTGPDISLYDYQFKNHVEKAVFQYCFVKQFFERIKKMNLGIRILELDYEEIISNPHDSLLRVHTYYGKNLIHKRDYHTFPLLRKSKSSVENNIILEIDNYLPKMNDLARGILIPLIKSV